MTIMQAMCSSMTIVPWLEQHPNPTDEESRPAISGNLCRCTGYQHIVEAVKMAANQMKETSP